MRVRINAVLAIISLLLTLMAVGAGTANATSATCLNGERLATQPLYYQGQEAGYLEIMWVGSTRQTCAHFHMDAGFRANHSGWNVTLWLFQDTLQPNGTYLLHTIAYNPIVTNTSATDFTTDPVSINNTTNLFTAQVYWTYNSCAGTTLETNIWNYNTGSAVPDSGAVYNGC